MSKLLGQDDRFIDHNIISMLIPKSRRRQRTHALAPFFNSSISTRQHWSQDELRRRRAWETARGDDEMQLWERGDYDLVILQLWEQWLASFFTFSVTGCCSFNIVATKLFFNLSHWRVALCDFAVVLLSIQCFLSHQRVSLCDFTSVLLICFTGVSVNLYLFLELYDYFPSWIVRDKTLWFKIFMSLLLHQKYNQKERTKNKEDMMMIDKEDVD